MQIVILAVLPLLASSYVVRQPEELIDSVEARDVDAKNHEPIVRPYIVDNDDNAPWPDFHADDDDVVAFDADVEQTRDDQEGEASDDDSDIDDSVTSSHETIDGVVCRKCPPGYGLTRICDARRETACERCVAGANYTSRFDGWHFRPCQPCSRCGDGMYAEAACSPSSDTFCNSCDGPAALATRNADFDRKCVSSADSLNVNSKGDSSESEISSSGESAEMRKFIDHIESVLGRDFKEVINRSIEEIPKLLPTNNNADSAVPLIAIDSVSAADMAQDGLRPENEHMKEPDRLEIQLLPDPLARAHSNWQRAPFSRNRKAKDGSAKRTTAASTIAKSTVNSSEAESVVTKLPLFAFQFGTRPKEEIMFNRNKEADQSIDSSGISNSGIIYKPSSHSYPYADLVHASYLSYYHLKQHRKLIILFLILFCLISLIILTLALLRKQSKMMAKRRRVAFAADLTDFDTKIIKECAQKLQQSEMRNKKRKVSGYDPFDDENENSDADSSMNVLENPLMGYLNENPQPIDESSANLISEKDRKPGTVNV